ncbi:MAG: peroxiredoxin [Phenylobacterium sp.]|nr:peroxiredoxin [Phenylobacterium sp.]
MKRLFALATLAAVTAGTPALADLAVGSKAPDFKAQAFLAGKPFTFDMAAARKKGPVVMYFFPSAYTGGCNLEAHLFSEAADEFKAQGATLIGVTAGKVERLAEFSADTKTCGGKFPVAADPGAKIAKTYDAPLKMAGIKAPVDMSARTSYVIAPDGTVLLAYDNMAADDHVNQTMGALKAWKAKQKKK